VSLLSHITAKKSTFAARSVPVHLSIPAIGVSVTLSELGKTSSGAVAIPTNWNQPGWYKYGPTPGQEGSAAILGHVDSVNGPAVFYKLSSLRPGDKVSVKLADGKTINFVVLGLRQYSKDNFPSKLVYGSRPYSALQLITCAGVFDSATHHYLSNLVVFTKRVVTKSHISAA
jgi:sortase (surface protein transpeptidase)